LAGWTLVSAAVPAIADPAAVASLSRSNTAAGVPVELRIEVTEARNAEVPGEIPVDGLEIVQQGKSTQFQLMNGQFTSRTVYTYRVTPEREGTFTIPSVVVEAGGRKLRTQELPLKVDAAAAGSAGATPDAGSQLRDMLFGDLVVPKETAYVGELVPVEVRIFVLDDGRVRPQAERGPAIQADGFTQKPFLRAREVEEQIKNRPFRVTVFQTHLTPAKAGNLEVGPGTLPVVVQVAAPGRSSNPMDAFFDDDFFRNPLQRFQQQRVQIQTGVSKLEVKPLPTEGRPPGFSGAVGKFEARIEASPRSGNVGDPITVKLIVTGRGDFDRVQAPELGKLPGWKTYPPTSKFTADGDAQTGGAKEFEFVLVPEAAHRTTPELAFSFFDPEAKQYETIPLPPIALNLTGAPPSAQPTPAPPVNAIPASTPRPTAAPAQPSAIGASSGVEILDILRDPGLPARSDVRPLIESPIFLFANGLVGTAFVVLVGWGLLRQRQANPEARRIRALVRARDRGLARLRETQGAEQLGVAVEVLNAAAGLRMDSLPAAPAAADLAQVLTAKAEDRDWIDALFRARDRSRYAGGAAPPTGFPDLVERIHALVRS